ncbi:MAG: acyl-CoA dehydrogenase family protein [Pseudomonadota bacterium]
MEFSLTEEQAAIAELAGKVFREHGSDEHVRQLAEACQTVDAHLWQTLHDTGLASLTLPESQGGAGIGMLELALVLQAQGRHLGAAPLWTHVLATLAVATHGSPSVQGRVLPALAAGTQIAGLATEFEAHVSLRATRDAQGWTLDGHLHAVLLDASHAWLVLPAHTDDGLRLFLVAADQAGMTRTSGVLTDLQPVCDLAFSAARVAQDSMLGAAAIDWLMPRMACCIAALQLGVVEEALHRAAAYVSERQQFGRPLGSFQALAVRAADAYIEVELLRSALWQLAWRLDQGLPATSAARVAKHQSSQAGYIVGHTAQHFHGGVGADLQYPIHRFYLKSQALSHIGGGAQAQLARIGQALAGEHIEDYEHE